MQKNYKKELLFKGNSVKRLVKEYISYANECNDWQAKIDKMKTEEADEYSLKKKQELMDETVLVRDSIKTKLRNATDDLTNLVNEVSDNETKDLEEYKNALEHLKASTDLFSQLS